MPEDSSEPRYVARPCPDNPDEWVVEFRDVFSDPGFNEEVYGARFYGPYAQRRAEHYAKILASPTVFGFVCRTTRVPDWLLECLKAGAELSDS
jgi:hypothetical protein